MDEILIVTALYPPEPVVSANISSDLNAVLAERGYVVKVFHPKPTRPNGYLFNKYHTPANNEIIAESFTSPKSSLFGRLKESISFGRASYRYIEKHYRNIGVIYANTWPLFGQFYLMKAAKKYGIPCYIHVQDIYPDSYCQKLPKLLGAFLYKTLLPIDKYVLRNAAGIIVISPAMVSYLSESRGINKAKFSLVRNWQNDQIYIDGYKPIKHNNSLCEVMYLGSINPTANVSLILEAFSRLDNKRFHLSVIGNGPEKEHCIDIADKYGLNVLFETVLPEKVADKQSEADILVLCLKKGVAHTATPSKLTAYMLTGRPIIASVDMDSDCANIIQEAGCGLVVEPENDEALAKAITILSEEKRERLLEMGVAAYNYALENLSKQKNLNKLTNVILNSYND